MADTLSKKTLHVSPMMIREFELVEKFKDLKLQVKFGAYFIRCTSLTIYNDCLSLIKEEQLLDSGFHKIVGLIGTN